jgi:PST family polysaccharide transporter
MVLLGAILAGFLLPELAKRRAVAESMKFAFASALVLLPVFSCGTVVLNVFGSFFVKTLFSPEFAGARDLIVLQTIGDGLRVLALPFHYLIISRGLLKVALLNELLTPLITVSVYLVLVSSAGRTAVMYGHVASGIGLVCLVALELGLFFRRKGGTRADLDVMHEVFPGS